jgi:hypothetical protein
MTDLILLLVLNGGYPLGVTRGVKGVYCCMWELGVGSGHT